MRVVIFEDMKHSRFYPLSYLRPVFALRCGRTTLAEKIIRQCPGAQVAWFLREELREVCAEQLVADGTAAAPPRINDPAALRDDDLFLVNGRSLALAGTLRPQGDEACACKGETLVWARVRRERLARWAAQSPADLAARCCAELPRTEPGVELIEYPWDLIHHNAAAIVDDFQALGRSGIHGKMSDQAAIWGPTDRLYLAPGAEVQPHVTFDTTGGPIIIGAGTKIQAHTRIEGPCAIGENCLIVGGKIREGCAIGPVCRVGGEVEESIIHAYSNKYHDGFLGHAYVGEWVNLGALTTNSDLKNDYSNVQVYCEGQLLDTGSPKVGAFIGDHTKTSIGTCLNTGTVLGIMCNIVGVGHLPPKYVPSFTMFVEGRLFKVGIKAQLETARIAMGRRKRTLTAAQEALIQRVFDLTREERNAALRKSAR